MEVSINILNYNSFEKSKVCIDSCLKQAGVKYRILLIDNLSTDNSFERLKEVYGKRIDFLQNGANYGFAKGNNLGVKYSLENSYKYSLLLNSDTELVGNNLLKELVTAIEGNPDSAVIVSDVYDVTSNGLIRHSNDSLYLKLLRLCKILPSLSRRSKTLSTISEAHGCAIMVNNNRFLEVGGFPEYYFMYGEESTFSKCILWKGYSLLWLHTGASYVLHHHDKAEYVDPWRLYLMGRNRGLEFYNYRKNYKLWNIAYALFFLKIIFSPSSKIHYKRGMKNSYNLIRQNKNADFIFIEGKNIKDNYR